MGPGGEGAAPQSAAAQLIQQQQTQRNDTNAWNVRRHDNLADLRGRS